MTTWDSDKDAVEFEKLAKKRGKEVQRSGRDVTVLLF